MASHFTDRALALQMPPSRKLLLAAIADSASWETRVSAPGADRMMAWAGVGKSQYQALITELVDANLVVRHRPGVKGRKAEYIVFPHGCCLEHGPLPGYGPMPEKVDDHAPGQPGASTAVDNHEQSAAHAPGEPDPLEPMGPAMGPVMQPVQTGPLPSYLPTEDYREGGSLVSRGLAEIDPPEVLPVNVAERPADAAPLVRCPVHLSDLAPPPCRACRAAREAHEAWAARQRLRVAEGERRAREERARERAEADAELRACRLCDGEGRMLEHRLVCDHDVAANARKVAARAELLAVQAELAARSAKKAHDAAVARVRQDASVAQAEEAIAAAEAAAERRRREAVEPSVGDGRQEALGA